MKRVIIVGASSGIGREVALQLLAQGRHVGLAARRTEPLEAIKALYPQQTHIASLDINTQEAPAQLLELIERLGGLDLYLHSSGIGKQNLNLEPDIELSTVNTNALGFTRMIDTAYNYFANQPSGGHIAVISSVAGTKGMAYAPSYSATKAFQNTYIQALEQQANARDLNIRFTDIRPGFVRTPLLDDGHTYPLLMGPETVAKHIVKAIFKKKHIAIIDWRYRLLIALWRRVPRAIWRHMKLS